MLKNIYKRIKSDRGDAILTMSIILIPLFCMCAGLAIDLTKSSYVKQSYINIAQEAGKESIKEIDIRGNLTPEAPVTFVNQYLARFTNDNQGGEGYNPRGSCTEVEIEDGVFKTAPYMEISLYAGRGDKYATQPKARYVSEGGAAPVASMEQGTDSAANEIIEPWGSFNTYKVISVRVWDTVPNYMMGWFGLPCQKVVTDTNSVTFGTFDDEENFTSPEAPTCFNTSFDGNSKITWSKPITTVTGYKVNLKKSSGVTVIDLPATATSYTNTALGIDTRAQISAIYPDGTIPNCQGYQGTVAEPTAICVTNVYKDLYSQKVGSLVTYYTEFDWNPVAGSPTFYYSYKTSAWNTPQGRYVFSSGSGSTSTTIFTKPFGPKSEGYVELRIWYGQPSPPAGCTYHHIGGDGGGL